MSRNGDCETVVEELRVKGFGEDKGARRKEIDEGGGGHTTSCNRCQL